MRSIKKYSLLSALIILSVAAHAQIKPGGMGVLPPDEVLSIPPANNSEAKINYVRTWEPRKPITDATQVPVQPVPDVMQTTTYADGLGRTVQTVNKQLSPLGKDAISYKVFDAYGRETVQYQRYVSSSADGEFKTNPFTEQKAFYQNDPQYTGEKVYYTKTIPETAPLGRVSKTLPPGNAWAGGNRGTGANYLINTTADDVKTWTVADAAGSMPYVTGAYAAGTLYKNVTTDENEKKTVEYKTKEGKVVLKKVQIDDSPSDSYGGWLCTYYIYDNYDNLRCVIQPEGVNSIFNADWSVSPTVFTEQCFRYEYDGRNRMIIKKVPGAGEVWMVYDLRDRLVMTQDANMRTQQQWMLTQYDELDRPVATGLVSSANDRAYFQSQTTYPAISEVLTNTYYDDYSYAGAKAFQTTDISSLSAGSNPWPDAVAKAAVTYGKVTGTRTKVLGTASQYLISTVYYDEKGRTIQSLADNVTGGQDITTTRYDFTDKPLSSNLRHTNPLSAATPATTVLTKMQYDAGGRLTHVWKQLNSDGVDKLIVQNTYDEQGQLKTKKLAPAYNSGLGLETETFDYSIRGWVKGVNKDYTTAANNNNWFGYTLSYENGFTKPQYNGNISGMQWRSKGDGEQRAYGYDYDNVNRLLKGDFTQYTGSSWNIIAGVDFSMKMGDGASPSQAYDKNGNIKAMSQNGLKINTSSPIDNLGYTYQSGSNKLQQVTDAANDMNSMLGDFKYDPSAKTATDYVYDANGNLTQDANKRITNITYNHLNLPVHIDITASPTQVYGGGYIEYTYDAAGNKLMKKVNEAAGKGQVSQKITTYVNGIVYETSQRLNGLGTVLSTDYSNQLQFIPHEEGRIRPVTNNPQPATFVYDYMLKDHLGNIRMVLTDEQKQDRYPAASLEPAKLATEKNYYTIDNGQIVLAGSVTGLPAYTNGSNGIPNNPADAGFEAANSAYLYQLNGSNAATQTGLGITLKVMAGDKIDIFGKSYYFQNNTGSSSANAAIPVTALLNGLLGGVTGAGATSVHGPVTVTDINTPAGTAGIANMVNNKDSETPAGSVVPRAYINYLFFDEQFKCTGSGFSKVGSNSALKDHHSELQNIAVPKNGYVYIYCSNESPVNVFFDNIQVVQTRGPLLEETHYYPFGLVQAGISSRAAGAMQNTEKTFQGQRFDEDLDLDWVQFKYRNHDPQIGRFIEIDPLSDKYVYNSTYAFSENKVIAHTELEGLETNPLTSFMGAVRQEFVNSARQVDNTFSKTETNDHEVSKENQSRYVEVKKSVETTETYKLNFGLGDWMYHVTNTNSNVGAPSLKLEVNKTTEVSDKTTTTVKTGTATITGTKLVSRTDGSTTTTVTVSEPIKLGAIPNANVAFSMAWNGNGSTTASANLSGSSKVDKTTYTGGANVSLTGQSGQRSNASFDFSVYGQTSSGKDVNTTKYTIHF